MKVTFEIDKSEIKAFKNLVDNLRLWAGHQFTDGSPAYFFEGAMYKLHDYIGSRLTACRDSKKETVKFNLSAFYHFPFEYLYATFPASYLTVIERNIAYKIIEAINQQLPKREPVQFFKGNEALKEQQ